jgi:DNA ligase (NAD+)
MLKEKLRVYSNTAEEKNVSKKRERQKIKNGKSLSITLSINNEGEYSEMPLVGMEFVITGRLEALSRQEAETRIKALGGTAKDNVTRNTTYLVVGAEPGSKLARAQTLGTKQLTEEDFLRLLAEKA